MLRKDDLRVPEEACCVAHLWIAPFAFERQILELLVPGGPVTMIAPHQTKGPVVRQDCGAPLRLPASFDSYIETRITWTGWN